MVDSKKFLPRFNFGKIQPKSKVSHPDDPLEQEADRAAERVMRMPEDAIQRKCSSCQMEDEEEMKISKKAGNVGDFQVPDSVGRHIDGIKGGGQPIDDSTRRFMESRFGFNFRKVKIHTEERAGRSAESINALAYTVGNNIVFGKGQYRSNTLEGKRLLAHELAHVVYPHPLFLQRKTIKEPYNTAVPLDYNSLSPTWNVELVITNVPDKIQSNSSNLENSQDELEYDYAEFEKACHEGIENALEQMGYAKNFKHQVKVSIKYERGKPTNVVLYEVYRQAIRYITTKEKKKPVVTQKTTTTSVHDSSTLGDNRLNSEQRFLEEMTTEMNRQEKYDHYLKYLDGKLSELIGDIMSEEKTESESAVISGISRFVGMTSWASLEDILDTAESLRHESLPIFMTSIDMDVTLRQYESADKSLTEFNDEVLGVLQRYNEFVRKVHKGAEISVEILEILKSTGTLSASILFGGVASTLELGTIGEAALSSGGVAAYVGTQETAEKGSSALVGIPSIGIKDIIKDSVKAGLESFVFGLIAKGLEELVIRNAGGYLSNITDDELDEISTIVGKKIARDCLVPNSIKIAALLVAEFAKSILKTSVETAYEKYKQEKDPNVQEIAKEIAVDTLSDILKHIGKDAVKRELLKEAFDEGGCGKE